MVTVILDKERHLRLTMRGMLAFEEKTGINIFKGFDFSNISLKDFTALLWACLLHEDKELKFDDFTDLVDLSNLTPLAEAVTQCIVESVPASEGTVPLAEKPQVG